VALTDREAGAVHEEEWREQLVEEIRTAERAGGRDMGALVFEPRVIGLPRN